MKTEKIQDVVKFHENFIKDMIEKKGFIIAQVAFCKGRVVTPIIIHSGREEIKCAMLFAKIQDPDWIVVMNEGYMKSLPKDKERALTLLSIVRQGDLQREFTSGNEKIKECVILSVYMKNGDKKMITYEKSGNSIKKIQEAKDFSGFLTFNDENVFDKIKREG
jgi:hypothetical protein